MSQRCVFIIGHAVVRIAKKVSETVQHRGLTESAKHAESNKVSCTETTILRRQHWAWLFIEERQVAGSKSNTC